MKKKNTKTDFFFKMYFTDVEQFERLHIYSWCYYYYDNYNTNIFFSLLLDGGTSVGSSSWLTPAVSRSFSNNIIINEYPMTMIVVVVVVYWRSFLPIVITFVLSFIITHRF